MTELSKTRYAEAETVLLSELGLADWQPKDMLTFTTDYASRQRAERIDADYFQPKYEQIVNAIKHYPGGWGTVANQVHLRDSNFKPEPEMEYQYIDR